MYVPNCSRHFWWLSNFELHCNICIDVWRIVVLTYNGSTSWLWDWCERRWWLCPIEVDITMVRWTSCQVLGKWVWFECRFLPACWSGRMVLLSMVFESVFLPLRWSGEKFLLSMVYESVFFHRVEVEHSITVVVGKGLYWTTVYRMWQYDRRYRNLNTPLESGLGPKWGWDHVSR